MHVRKCTDFALRVLICLAQADGEVLTLAQVARTMGLRRNHLTKIVHRLVAFGYVGTLRGRNGGLYLNRAPQFIVVGEVFRNMEQGTGIVRCLEHGADSCLIEHQCRLKGILIQAHDRFLSTLDDHRLCDLIEMPRRKSEEAVPLRRL